MDTSVAFRLEKLVLTRPQSQSLLSTLSGRGVLIPLLIDLEKGLKVLPERPVCSSPALSLKRLSTCTALWREGGASGPCLLAAPPPLFLGGASAGFFTYLHTFLPPRRNRK